METLPRSKCNNSRRQRSACKMVRLMMLHVNIYFCRRPLQNSSLENIATILIFLIIKTELKYFFSDKNYRRIRVMLQHHALFEDNL